MFGGEEDKKHPATPAKRKRAREAGQVARSHDLSSSLVLLLGLMLLWWSGPQIMLALTSILTSSLTNRDYAGLDGQAAAHLLAAAASHCGRALAPLMGGVCGVALLNNWLQAGRIVAPQPLSLQWDRVNPTHGLSRLTGLPNFAKLGFGLIKVAAILAIVAGTLWGRWQMLLNIHDLTLIETVHQAWNMLFTICVQVALALLALAIADYGFQWWQLERSLRMTDEELREETKATGIHPQIANQRKKLRKQLAPKA